MILPKSSLLCLSAVAALATLALAATMTRGPRQASAPQDLDTRVRAFLAGHEGTWRDLNVPARDGQILYDLVLKNHYTRALEIGTSTGHSGIWIAWALSKTGGKLITIEIDEGRHREAVANFKEAGLSDTVDARLGDAHEIVPALSGPFDVVVCDADKDGYTNYFLAVLPKLEVGGCFAAHNVSPRMRGYGAGSFVAYVEALPGVETVFVPGSSGGISASYKRK